jgi:hypothetical protein
MMKKDFLTAAATTARADIKFGAGLRVPGSRIVKNSTALLLILGLLSACGTLSRKVDVTSIPEGASVRTRQGQPLGVTPLTLEADALTQASDGNQLAVVLAAPGHLERELLMDLHARQSHTVALTPARPEAFRESLISTYASDINALSREILQIHGLIINRRAAEAEKRIAEFQKVYPSIAATHVMLARLLAKQGKPEEAKKQLLRALSLDPRDPVASRALLGTAKETPTATAADPTRQPAEVYPATETAPASANPGGGTQ